MAAATDNITVTGHEDKVVESDLKIYDGSAGWDSASRRAFCVVSADGKFRSNLIAD